MSKKVQGSDDMSAIEVLFEKFYLQCAKIAILEEALAEAKADFKGIDGDGALNTKVKNAIEKIDIAYKSIDKLKAESNK